MHRESATAHTGGQFTLITSGDVQVAFFGSLEKKLQIYAPSYGKL